MPTMTELEIKLLLDAAAAARWDRTLRAQGGLRVHLQALYLDTEDGALGAARIALRLRREGRRWVQTLKAAGEGPLRRLEHEVPVPAPRGGGRPAPELARHDGTEAGRRLRAALDGRDEQALVVRHETDVWRRLLRVRTPQDTGAELALDLGTVRAAGREEAIRELEIEHLDGPLDGLFALARSALDEGGAWLSTRSKAEAGEALRAGSALPPPAVRARQLTLGDDPARADGVQAVLVNTLAQVLPNASELVRGQQAEDTVHQLRIGLRRLRTVLRELGGLDGHRLRAEWEPALAEAFGRLGERRDDEVVLAAVQPLLEAAGAPLCRWPASAPADPVAAVRALPLQQTLLAVIEAAHAGPAAEGEEAPDGPAVRRWMARRLDRLHRQVRRESRQFEQLPLERQHRLRRRLKRLRYLAEFARPWWKAKAVDRYTAALATAQDRLGQHHDTALAAGRFRALATDQPDAGFAAGFLHAHLAVTARRAGKALRGLDKRARPFWQAP